MLDPFSLPFFQRGVAEVLVLAVIAGVLGTWIVLRGLSFFAHAAGTATFPGLVLADGAGFSATLGASVTALLVAGLVAIAGRRRGTDSGTATALVLAGALAAGVILASDVYGSQARVDGLLFGSLLTIGPQDVRFAVIVAMAATVASLVAGSRWLATGFSGAGARAGWASADAVLLLLTAMGAVAALAATGSLLATALLVVPAATTRLLVDRVGRWQLATIALAAVEGVAGLWLAFQLDVPPGAAIAVLTGVVFAAAAGLRALRRGGLRRVAAGAAAAALLTGAAGCATSGSGTDRPVTVAATTTQLGDLARAVGGDRVHVRQLLQPNSDPHDYEPRPKDALTVSKADAVFVSGLGLDAWSRDLVRAAGGGTVVDVGASVPVHVNGSGGDAGSVDPHWWHDPVNGAAAVDRIARELSRIDPAGAAGYARRAAAERRRIERLGARIRACVARVPVRDRRIVTDHDAFGYFTRRFGITVAGAVIPSNSTQAQASAGDVASLERAIRRTGVRAVFPEQSVSPRLARQIAADTGAAVGGRLYGDTLGPAGSPGATYTSMLAANAARLVRGMSGGAVTCRP